MNKFTRISAFAEQLLDDPKTVQPASEILTGILESRSPRMSDRAARLAGGEAAGYRRS
jgi:hypothetical protein